MCLSLKNPGEGNMVLPRQPRGPGVMERSEGDDGGGISIRVWRGNQQNLKVGRRRGERGLDLCSLRWGKRSMD